MNFKIITKQIVTYILSVGAYLHCIFLSSFLLVAFYTLTFKQRIAQKNAQFICSPKLLFKSKCSVFFVFSGYVLRIGYCDRELTFWNKSVVTSLIGSSRVRLPEQKLRSTPLLSNANQPPLNNMTWTPLVRYHSRFFWTEFSTKPHVHLEPLCCKKGQKKSLSRNWFGEQGNV